MDFVQIDRNWYDPKDPKHLSRHKVEIWPGFISAISQYESSLLCIEPKFKAMQSETVPDALWGLNRRNRPGFHDAAYRRLVG